MPKKWLGENTKAGEARARKVAQQEAEKEKHEKQKEDEFWRDDDKHVAKKQQRKEEREKKKQEQVDRKNEKAALLLAEEQKLIGFDKSSDQSLKKVTQAEIHAQQLRMRLEREREEERQRLCAKKIVVLEECDLEENVNRIAIEGDRATTVEEAIEVLTDKDKIIDKNPEKRLKASFAAFEEKCLPRLKADYPNMRLSQLKQMIKKEWMKSPENPMVQQTLAASAVT